MKKLILSFCLFSVTQNMQAQIRHENRVLSPERIESISSTPVTSRAHVSTLFDKIQKTPSIVPKKLYSDNCALVEDSECQGGMDLSKFNFMKKILKAMKVKETSSKLEMVAAFSEEDCACLKTRLSNDVVKYDPVMVEEKKQKIKDALIKKAGEKFINDYASNIEDINYYVENRGDVFAKKPNSKTGAVEYEENLSCNDSALYAAKMEELCPSDITKEIRRERLNLILSSYGNLKGESIKEKFSHLNEQILTLIVDPSELPPGSPNTFQRKLYDKFRFGLIEKEPQVTFIDQLVTELLQNKKLRKKVFTQDEGTSPLEAMKQVLYDPKNRMAISAAVARVKASDRKFYQNLPDLKDADFQAQMDQTFHRAMGMHPGLKSLLRDSELFENVHEELEDSKGKTMLTAMETEKKALVKHFKTRCEEMISNIAHVVCLNDKSAKKDISRSEVAKIAEDLHDPDRSLLVDAVLICDYDDKEKKTSAFTHLVGESKDPYSLSDFQNRKRNKLLKDQDNGFAKTMLHIGIKKDKELENYVTEVIQKAEAHSVSAPIFLTNSSFNSSDAKVLTFKTSPQVNKVERSVASETEATATTAVNQDREIATPTHTATAPTAPQTVFVPQRPVPRTAAPLKAVDEKNITLDRPQTVAHSTVKEELDKIIEQDLKDKELKKHVGHIEDRDAKELIELRKARLKDLEEISELKLLEEKRKREELKNNYIELEKRYAEILKVREEKQKQEKNVDGGNMPKFTEKVIHMYNGQTGGMADGMENSDAPIRAASGKISDSALAASVAARREAPADAKNGLQLVVQKSSDKTASTQDPNEQLELYLSRKKPDLSELKRIISSGLVLTYEQVRPDGKIVRVSEVITYEQLTPKTKELIDQKMTELVQQARREYSIQALKFEFLYADRLHRKRI